MKSMWCNGWQRQQAFKTNSEIRVHCSGMMIIWSQNYGAVRRRDPADIACNRQPIFFVWISLFFIFIWSLDSSVEEISTTAPRVIIRRVATHNSSNQTRTQITLSSASSILNVKGQKHLAFVLSLGIFHCFSWNWPPPSTSSNNSPFTLLHAGFESSESIIHPLYLSRTDSINILCKQLFQGDSKSYKNTTLPVYACYCINNKRKRIYWRFGKSYWNPEDSSFGGLQGLCLHF